MMSDPGFIIFFIAAFLAVMFIAGRVNEKRSAAALRLKLKKTYGGYPGRNYAPEEIARIPRYFEKHRENEAWVVDDITANDLDLFSLFARVNYCHSAAGEEVLYHMLRTPSFDEAECDRLEKEIAFLSANEDMRLELELKFAGLGGSGKYSVYDYLDQLDFVKEKSNAVHYLGIAALFASIILMIFSFAPGFVLLLLVAAWQIISYYREKGESDAYLSTFSYILRLIVCARGICSDIFEKAAEPVPDGIRYTSDALGELINKMQSFSRGASILMSSSRMSGSGNPLDILADYLRMLFHVDIIKFRQMLNEVKNHREDVDELITVLGGLEAAISVVCYRASLPGGDWCVPEFLPFEASSRPSLCVEELRHALIDDGAVSNSADFRRGVLLTGSNASGKSTWLKALGLASLMAETIHTVTARAYRAPLFRVYSSMALSDNLKDGESYYIVEIRALSRILAAAKAKFPNFCGAEKHEGETIKAPPIICFIDEVLRGTNTIERIAASAQILCHFAADNAVLTVAATHDIELSELLSGIMDNFHFEGSLTDDDVSFDYKLKEGPSLTRNAIGLLKRFSYDPEITERAEAMAKRFEDTGVWSMEILT